MAEPGIDTYLHALKALSDSKRFRILRLLSRMDRKICVCEVMKVLDMPQHEASKSLKQIKDAGFTVCEKEGRFVYYRLNPDMPSFNKDLVCSIKKLPDEGFEDDEINCRKFCGQICQDSED